MGRDMANSRVTKMARRPPPGPARLFTGAKWEKARVPGRRRDNPDRGGWRIYEISSPMHNKNLFRDATETPPPAPHPAWPPSQDNGLLSMLSEPQQSRMENKRG